MTAPALSEFERKVQEIMAAFPGVPRDKAEASVRLNFPRLVAPAQLQLARADNVREKEEQAFIAKLFRGFGCKVYNLSQARASKQTPGLPDLWVVHRAAKLAFWFEVKRASGGKISAAQTEFAQDCYSTGVAHFIGDRRVAREILLEHSLAKIGDGPLGIVPFHEGR